jgi:hypothetical protein
VYPVGWPLKATPKTANFGLLATVAAWELRGAPQAEPAGRIERAFGRLRAGADARAGRIARTRFFAFDTAFARPIARARDVARRLAADDFVLACVDARAVDFALRRQTANNFVTARPITAQHATRNVRRAEDVVRARIGSAAIEHAHTSHARTVRAAERAQVRVGSGGVDANRRCIDSRRWNAVARDIGRRAPTTGTHLATAALVTGRARHRAVAHRWRVAGGEERQQRADLHTGRRLRERCHPMSLIARRQVGRERSVRGEARISWAPQTFFRGSLAAVLPIARKRAIGGLRSVLANALDGGPDSNRRCDRCGSRGT